MIIQILVWYGILIYIGAAFFIYSERGWTREWESADLLFYMTAPISVPMFVLFTCYKSVLDRLPRPNPPRYPEILVILFIIIWVGFVSLLKYLFI